MTQEFDTLFNYTFQEVSKLKRLNINIIQSKDGISFDRTYHIIKNIIQDYWSANHWYIILSSPRFTSLSKTLSCPVSGSNSHQLWETIRKVRSKGSKFSLQTSVLQKPAQIRYNKYPDHYGHLKQFSSSWGSEGALGHSMRGYLKIIR